MYSRWSLYTTSATLPVLVLPGLLMGAMAVPTTDPVGPATLVLVVAAQTVVGIALLRAGLTTLLGGRPPDRGLIVAAVALTAAAIPVAGWAVPEPPTGTDVSLIVLLAPLIGGTLTTALTPILSRRGLLSAIVVGAAVSGVWYGITVDDDWPAPLGPALVYTAAVGLFTLFYRVTEWTLVLVWEIDAARAVQARLAVAEERLRFARDVHDVLGRNLTLIAVTSELAAGLGRRGEPAAVEKMLQVRGLAHESAREVRELVAGYRTTDLDTELAGGASVLRAAGITTRIIGDGAALSEPARTAFGWVLREAITNVIRHSAASTCTIEIGSDSARRAELRVHSDGAKPTGPDHPPGHGLAGLAERVTALGGELRAGPEPGGGFTVAAQLPITNDNTPALDPTP